MDRVLYAIDAFIAAVFLTALMSALAYVIGRAASLGWYKSKMEHFKKVWKHMTNGEP